MIKASLEIIWTLMIQHLKYPEKEAERGSEWDKLVIKNIKGKVLTSNKRGVGVRTRWYYKCYFYTFKWDDEVVEWEEMKKMTWKSISTWDMVDSFIIKPASKETRLTYEMNYTPPYWIFGKIWYHLLVHKHLEKHLEYVLIQMKKSAEATAKFKEITRKQN